MQSQVERERLLKLMGKEPVGSWLVLAKCAAGLAAVALIAVIGLGAPINIAAPTLKSAIFAAAAGARAHMRSQPHRKQVFDERRARFQGGVAAQNVAGQAGRPANRSLVAMR